MARQKGPILIIGTIDDLTFYEMNGKGYVRKKSCLDKKRFYRKPSFSNSRRAASHFGDANKFASGVYRLLPRDGRNMDLYRELIPIATHMLKYQHSKEEVVAALQAHIDLKKKKAQPQSESSYKRPALTIQTHTTPSNVSAQKSKRAIRRLRSYTLPPNPS